MGTREGAPIPSGTGFVSDRAGNVVIARADIEGLAELATAGGGRLSRLSQQGADDLPWADADGEAFSLSDDGLGERWKDTGPFFVLLLLPLVAVGFRRGLLFLVPLVLLPSMMVPLPAEAGVWDDLWQRRDQQAQQALADEKPGEAASLAKYPGISGEAWYRTGEFQRAAGQWQGLDAADDHYNRGNALAQAGDLDGAIAAYDEALAREPGMEDALFNKALVEQMKQQQEQEGEDQSGEGEESEGDPSDSDSEGEQGDEQENAEPQEGEGEGEQEESESEEGSEGQPSEQQMNEAWSEEDAQAMEQWLRRIPDDPGGLLRRKFRNEHQRRGAPPDERETW